MNVALLWPEFLPSLCRCASLAIRNTIAITLNGGAITNGWVGGVVTVGRVVLLIETELHSCDWRCE